MKNKLILPKKYIDNSVEQKYAHLNGSEKISYSQLTSFTHPDYNKDYIKQYFAGITLPDGIFAKYGSCVGTTIEAIGKKEELPKYDMLSETDLEVIKKLDYPENSIYEDYIVVDLGEVDGSRLVIEGYIDRSIYLPDNEIIIEDFKTGSIAKKKEEYASDKYNQTRLYSYQKENEGYKISDTRVLMLDRAGNGSPKSPIRLTGKTEFVPTPYVRAETEMWLESVKKTAIEISDLYQTYLKYFG